MVRRLSEGDRGSMNLGMMATGGFTVWLTGMSGSGKSTLAQGLANRLRRPGKVADVLDGPDLDQRPNVGGPAPKAEGTPKARKLAWGGRPVPPGGGTTIQSPIET